MAQGFERIPLAVDSDFQAQPVRANFPEQASQEIKIISFEPDQLASAPVAQPRTVGVAATDTLYGMAKGAGSLAKGIGWLVGSDTLQQAGQVAEDYWGEKQSADLHRQLEAVGKAEGVTGTIKALWDNPAAIGDYIATSLPMMVPGMGVGSVGARGIIAYAGNAARSAALRGGATEAAAMEAGKIAATKAAEKAATRFAVGANMLGEGAVSGGTTGAEVEQFALEHGATPAQAKTAANQSALTAGAWTTAGAGIGAGMETRAMLGRLKDTGYKGMVKNVGKEALEEAIQNPGEDYASYAGKVQFDPSQTFDPGKSATLGAVTGGAMGAGFHAAGRASAMMAGEEQQSSGDAIPAEDIGIGDGPSLGGKELAPYSTIPNGDGIEGDYLPADQRTALPNSPEPGTIYDQDRPALPSGQPLLTGPQPMEGDVLGPETLPPGQRLLQSPAIDGTATEQGGEFARPALPSPEQGGPTERQVAVATGLLKHSPNASPDMLMRMMQMDQTMATMLFNHWQGKQNGQVAGGEAPQEFAQGGQGSGAVLPGSGAVAGVLPGPVSSAMGQSAEAAVSGVRKDVAVPAAGAPSVTPLDVQAHAAATSPFNATPQPTEAQKIAGNYTKGHVKFQGMDIAIENPAGSVRSGKDDGGREWQTQMQHHYGYIKGTVGRDKDHLDVFIKPGAQTARTAYVIDQTDPKTGAFDEHKIIIGADSEADARAIYQANYEQGWNGLGAITAMPMEDFKAWIKSGNTKKPLAYKAPKGAHAAPKQSQAPAAKEDSGGFGKVGVMPNTAKAVSLADNGDGTATVMRGDEPFYDFDSGEPVTVPAGTMPQDVRKAVEASGAMTSKDRWFATKAEDIGADAGKDAEQFERAMRAAATKEPSSKTDVRTTALRYVPFDTALQIAKDAVAAGVKPVPAQFHTRLDLTMDSADRLIAGLKSGDQIAGKAVAEMSAPTLEQIAKSSQPAAEKAKAELARRQEQGPFGPIYRGFENQPEKAIDHLMAVKNGEVPDAFTHPELGEIAFVYGDEKMGLRHIAEKRGMAFVRRIPDLLRNGRVERDSEGLPRSYVVDAHDPANVAVIRLEWDRKQKTWLVTAYVDGKGEFAGGDKRANTTAAGASEVPVSDGVVFSREPGNQTLADKTADSKEDAIAGKPTKDMSTKALKLIANAKLSSPAAKEKATKELAKRADAVDYKGFKRIDGDDGAFSLFDGNMIVKVSPTGPGKYQAAFLSAKSSPHLQGEQGAVDWADNYRAEGKKSAQSTTKRGAKKDSLADIREFYTPGNVIHVDYWNTFDRVIEFKDGDLPGQWSVKVQQVVKDGDKWVPKDLRLEPPRWHATAPGKDKVVFREPVKSQNQEPVKNETQAVTGRPVGNTAGDQEPIKKVGSGGTAPTIAGKPVTEMTDAALERLADGKIASDTAKAHAEEELAKRQADTQPVADETPVAPEIDIDAELQDALGHLGDVLGEVFGGQMNITGKQYGAGDLLPALSKVMELLIRKGFRSFKQAAVNAAKLMRSNGKTSGFVDQVSARQWKAAYQAVAELHEGTDSEDVVSAMTAADIAELLAIEPEQTEDAKPATGLESDFAKIVRLADIAGVKNRQGDPISMSDIQHAYDTAQEGTDKAALVKTTIDNMMDKAKDELIFKASDAYRATFPDAPYIKSESQITSAIKNGALDISSKPWATDFYDLFKIDPSKIRPAAKVEGLDSGVAEQLARFNAGIFKLPSTITGNIASKEARSDAKAANEEATRNYVRAAREFLEGPLTAKVPGKKDDLLNLEFLENVRPQPVEKKIKKVKSYADQIKALLTIAAEDDIRFYLKGIHVLPEEKRLVATDGHRMAILDSADLSGLPQMEDGKTILNRNAGKVSKITKTVEPVWHDGRFPDWQRVVPDGHKFAPETFNSKRVADYARAVAKAGRYAATSNYMPVAITIGDLSIHVNSQYLADAADLFQAFGYDTFVASSSTGDKGGSVYLESPDHRLRQVVMPLRTDRLQPVFLPIVADDKVAKQSEALKDAPQTELDRPEPDAYESRGIDLENRGVPRVQAMAAVREARDGDESLLKDLERIAGVEREETKAETVAAEPETKPAESETKQPESETDAAKHDADVSAFTAGMTALQRANAIKALDVTIRVNGIPMSRKGFVHIAVAEDRKIEQREGERALVKPDGAYQLESQISKTAMDYAEFLLKQAGKPANSESGPVDAHYSLMDRLREGTAPLADYKAGFESLLKAEAEIKTELATKTKDQLLKMGGAQFASNYKSDKKDRVVDGLYRNMVSDYTLHRGLTYVLGGRGDSQRNAVVAMVEGTSEETLKEFASKIAAARSERAENREKAQKAIEDPKTLDDFVTYIRFKKSEGMDFTAARMTLTPEQRALFDKLTATQTRDARKARADQQKTDIRATSTTTEGQVFETKHTRTGEPLFVVKAAERVEREVYNQWNATAKKLGGWYSSYRGAGAIPGFQFKTRENADAFLSFLGGNTEQAKQVVQERRDAFADDKSQTAVERLNEMADRLADKADESLGYERKANTARRARFAASAEAAANADKALAGTMRNIAKAIEDGTAQFLDRVRQKSQVEMLRGFLSRAKDNELRAKYPSYAEQERHKGEPASDATADYADFPQYVAFRSDLANLGRKMIEHDGAKKLGASLLKVADDATDAYLDFAKKNLHKVSTFKTTGGGDATFASRDDAETAIKRSGYKGKAIVLPFKRGQNIIILSPTAAKEKGIWPGDDDKRITLTAEFGAEIVAKDKELARYRLSVPYTFHGVSADRARLSGMGIETPAEFRAALREFIAVHDAPNAPSRIKQLERAMVGRKNDGLDFFPTPASVADRMVEAAGIEEGMSVLEPSAGMGHIADRIAAAGADPDVVEMSADRRELLEAKGYRLVASDFMDMSPRGFTYGDVFRHKDGREGVMRGSGGMGSNRVGFIPEGADARQSEWVDRDELSGARKSGSDSGYDRIIMNPPFSDRRDAEHVRHAYSLLRPGGRIVAIMGEGVFFGQDKKAQEFRDWLDEVGGTSEKLEEGTFLDPSLPVNTGVNARMVVIDKSKNSAMESRRAFKPVDTGSAEFKRWFKQSKATDAGGNPLIVYHGGPDIRFAKDGGDGVFQSTKERLGMRVNDPDRAFFFTSSYGKAKTYTDERRAFDYQNAEGGIVGAYLSLQNPLVIDAGGTHWRDAQQRGKTSDVVEEAKANGHDGLIIRNVKDNYNAMPGDKSKAGDVFVVFNPEQIKSSEKNTGEFGESNPSIFESKAADTDLQFAANESARAVQSVVEKFKQQFAGTEALNIRVAKTVAEIPARFRPSRYAEGVFHDDAGLIYLVVENLKHANGQVNTGRAWQVLMHEAVGHYGLARMMGERFAGILSKVKAATKTKGEIRQEDEDFFYEPGHPDYATWDAVQQRYPEANESQIAQEVLARMAETDPGRTLFGYVRAVVRQWLRDMARAARFDVSVSSAELNDLVAQASAYMRRGDGLNTASMPSGTVAASKARGMESRGAATASNPRQPGSSRRGLLDSLLRTLGGELAAKITSPAYDRLTSYLGGKIPEGIKAGIVSDYGLNEDYIDRRTDLQTEQQKAARKTKTFVESLMMLDRAQSRVAYQWLNNRGAEADRLMAQLPEESQQTLKDIKQWIAELTTEAVRLGQLDAETASRNFMAYLHRSYAKHDLNTDDKTWKAERAKAIKIMGDQYKGRGLKMDVTPDRIVSAPGWWSGEMKGKRVKVLKKEGDRAQWAFVAEGTAIPARYADYRVEGIWEIRARKNDNQITLWRDFTQEERTMMGELDEAKYAVARTLFMMTRDIEVGRFHEWVADEYAKLPEDADAEGVAMADASESMMRAFRPDEWVAVPTAKVPGAGVFKYGSLAGMVVPGPIWNDIRQISAARFEPLGGTYASILRAWKLSKTALTPTTHINNIMGNFVMADMHDVGARDVISAVRLMAAASGGDADAKAMIDRFEDSGATQGMFTTHELKTETLEPLLKALREEVGMADDEGAILKASAILSLALHGQIGEAWAGAKAAVKQSAVGRGTSTAVTKAQDYYQAEDTVFRLAAFLKMIGDGKSDREAGKLSRKAFLDYHINAPWINAMRGTAMPFIAFSYRAIPMLVETAARKPWKLAKYMLVAGGLNALAYAMLGADADEDKERAYLPDEKSGKLWGVVPKLIRMPWNRESKFRDGRTSSDPVFLDVRRWIPVGDLVDFGQDKTALPLIPQPMMPGGPMVLMFEGIFNKSAFTGKEISKETDTYIEKAAKVADHFYKGFAPNLPIPHSGTWAGTKIDNAIKGKEDPLGRVYPLPEAVASGFGIKLERYPVDGLRRNAVLDMKGKLRELDEEKRRAARDYSRNGMTRVELDEKIGDVVAKKRAVVEEFKGMERRAEGVR